MHGEDYNVSVVVECYFTVLNVKNQLKSAT